jgi:geranylgeranyl diphosphate synthase type I
MTTTTAVALDRCGPLLRPAMSAAVDRLDAESRRAAAYHLGWVDLDGQPTASAGGKSVRPALALLGAQTVGVEPDVAVPGAVAVELVHNFSLLHDDLMDGDTRRRHRPTVWAVWGPATAILTGDALHALALEVLLDSGSPRAASAGRLLARTVRRLVAGQVADLQFEQRDDVTVPECLRMVADKTGALLSTSASIGAVLAGGPRPVVDALARFGAELGIAFQLVDDLLGIWGDPDVTGKPVFSDLRSRKKTLPVTYAAASDGAAGRALRAWLASPDGTDGPRPHDEGHLRRAADLVDAAGGRRWALAEAERRIDAGQLALDSVGISGATRAELTELARFTVARQL